MGYFLHITKWYTGNSVNYLQRLEAKRHIKENVLWKIIHNLKDVVRRETSCTYIFGVLSEANFHLLALLRTDHDDKGTAAFMHTFIICLRLK